EGHKKQDLVAIGVFINGKLVGFGFSEVLNSKFANFHFWKANITVSKTLYSFLFHEKAKLLWDKYECEFLNIEQDLGIENLRKWKSSFGDFSFLKKFIVQFNN